MYLFCFIKLYYMYYKKTAIKSPFLSNYDLAIHQNLYLPKAFRG